MGENQVSASAADRSSEVLRFAQDERFGSCLTFITLALTELCHPEARCSPKDLPGRFDLDLPYPGFSITTLVQNLEAAFHQRRQLN
jgi:hypothetical protein